MTKEHFKKLQDLLANIEDLEDQLEILEKVKMEPKYDMFTLVGRVADDELGDSDPLLYFDEESHPGLLDLIVSYIRERRDRYLKEFEEG